MCGSEARMQIDGDKVTEQYWVLTFYILQQQFKPAPDSSKPQEHYNFRHSRMIFIYMHTQKYELCIYNVHTLVHKISCANSSSS